MRTSLWVIVAAVPVLVAAALVFDQQTRLGGKLRAGGQIVIPPQETVQGDLYAMGGDVRIEGTVEGDLVAMSGQVQVSGAVGGDLLVAGGTVDISGQVDGDARVGAGQLTVGGSIGEDLFAGTGQATITSSGEVGEDFVFGTGQTTLDGQVADDVLGGTGRYVRRGSVGGTEDVTITRRKDDRAAAGVLLDALQRFLSLLAVAALFLWLAPRIVEGAADTLRRRSLASLGVGALGAVAAVVGVVAFVFIAALVGIALGLLRLEDLVGVLIFGTATAVTGFAFVVYVALGFVAQAVVGLMLGRLALGADRRLRWWALALGVLAVVLVSIIPIVGPFLGLIISVLGLGALILEFWPWRPAPQPARATRTTRTTGARRKTAATRKTPASRRPRPRKR
ncbi:MAG TPA: polymer-forming cytoskeletal protein [Actinomycetota bacterium]|nr:polymer-forming cytoskeletal protein [Actinomycetota bacterium]